MVSEAHAENLPNSADTFAPLQILVSRIDSERRSQEVVDEAKNLNAEECQLLLDVLSTAISKIKTLSQHHAYAWFSLIKIASSAHIFAQNRIVKSEYILPGDEGSGRVKVLRQIENNTLVLNKKLVEWAHLSHPNILPLYAAFLETEDRLCFVSPCTSVISICDHARGLTGDQRVPLVLDVATGLHYLHQLGIVHGRLSPETVVIAYDGRALITDLDTSFEEQDSDLPTRFLSPELLTQDDNRPTKATDIWSFACLAHEVISGKPPFHQFLNDFRAVMAIGKGDKPARPGQDGRGGNVIGDAMWNLLMTCWAYKAEDRPTSLRVLDVLSHMCIEDDRPAPKLMIEPEALKTSAINFESAKIILTQVLSSHQRSLQVPKHLRETLSRLVCNRQALKVTTVAAKKLNHNDTQTLTDFIELVSLCGLCFVLTTSHPVRPGKVVKDLPYLSWSNFTGKLLHNIMRSTHTFPQHYQVNGIRYDSAAVISTNPGGRIYAGRGLRTHVYVATRSLTTSLIVERLALWANASHPNLLPFHGVFHERATEPAQLCSLHVILPCLEKGTIQDYAPALPQVSRLLLISDVVGGLVYLQNTLGVQDTLTGQGVVISNEGRALIASFGADFIFLRGKTASSCEGYSHRFVPPDTRSQSEKGVTWSFGCLSYEVLSRKIPYYQTDLSTATYKNFGKVLSRKIPYYQFLDEEVEAQISQGQPLKRPDRTDAEMDEIDDKAWELITKCCALRPDDRPDWSEIQEMLANMEIEEDRRPSTIPLLIPEVQALRFRPEVDLYRAEAVLDQVYAEVLREPLSKLIKNHTKDVAAAIVELGHDEIQTLVNYLDQAVKDNLSIPEERNRVLAILSRVTSSTLIFPQRYELKGISSRSPRKFIVEGGCGTLYQGADPTMCIKMMKQLDIGTLMSWVKEVILWAHSSHPNVLPFLGVFLEGHSDSPQTCLVSPFMKNGNLRNYAERLAQKRRLPLISDVADGLCYLHNLGIVHGDLKGENVLISDEGRSLITDFGTSFINTDTTATGSISSTTLRFSAPETILGNRKPTKEFDIWSLGCLFYTVLSRKVPYYQYYREVQIIVALSRKEPPKRPGSLSEVEEEDEFDWDDWDDDIKQDYDAIDDQAWDLIIKCCSPEPEDRPDIADVRELIIDMKIHDDRPALKAAPGAEILKLRVEPKMNWSHVEELLDHVQEKLAARVADDSTAA
ncbi:Serine/threonine-protein kinase HT1 [Leucoagaricus sp. SymC.cos]|nr:Serine/threonine-protein kinase HT1 [Leucoagaricus sp. SymC.cos]